MKWSLRRIIQLKWMFGRQRQRSPRRELRMQPHEDWAQALSHLAAAYRSDPERCAAFDEWLTGHFDRADKDNDGLISFRECVKIFRQMNYFTEESELRSHFRGVDHLNRKRFIELFNILQQREDIREIFNLFKNKDTFLMGPEELQTFLRTEQHEERSRDECKMIIEDLTKDPFRNWGHGDRLNERGFEAFLLSEEGDIFDSDHYSICQDMTRPLNEYFIASSHNTYLLEGQLVGESSINGYISALRRGCRCLELDVWDGIDNEPVIYHGRTLTSKIFLKDAIKTIKEHAFLTNPYPILLSIENHCDRGNEAVMTKYFCEIFGDMLCTEPISDQMNNLPSPEQLKGKILIKAKKKEHGLTKQSRQDSFLSSLSVLSSNGSNAEFAVSPVKDTDRNCDDSLEERSRMNSITSSDTTPSSMSSKRISFISSNRPAEPVQLSDICNYCVATKFSSFVDTKTWRFNQMASFSEAACEAILSSSKGTQAFVDFARHHLTRVYPKATRIYSENFDPMPFFSIGCQLVALNYQTADKYRFYNLSMFAQNGNCGYVLKPSALLEGFNHGQPDPDLRRRLTVTIISGQFVPAKNEPVDPYVEVKVIGHPLDEKTFQTRYADHNVFNAIWKQTFEFDVNVPDLAQLVFTLMSDSYSGNHRKIGEYAVPLTAMRQGYRHIHLRNLGFKKVVPSTLFVKVSLSKEGITAPIVA